MSVWPFAEPVTIHRRTKTTPDSDGNDAWTETDVAAKAALYPFESTELTDAQDTSIQRINALFVPPVGVAVTDEVTARGNRWQVDGEPGDYASPLTNTKAEKVTLRRVTG